MIFEEGLIYDSKNLDLDGMREYAKEWNKEWSLLESGEFQGRIVAVHTVNMQLGLTTYSLPVEIVGSYPEGTVLIFFLQQASQSTVYKKLKIENDDVAIISSQEEINFLSSGESSVVTLSVEKSLFFEEFRSFFDQESLEILPQQKFKIVNGGGKKSLSEIVTEKILSLQDRNEMEKIDLHKLEKEMLNTLFTHIKLEKLPQEHSRFDITKVRDYLKENFEDEISIEQIAKELSISKRQLHDRFRSFYGLTPKKYLQVLRLHEVHKILLSSTTESTTVSEIAFKYGFRHLSFFTQEYKKLFNELPSESLKR